MHDVFEEELDLHTVLARVNVLKTGELDLHTVLAQ
jgi:hypothetical protein